MSISSTSQNPYSSSTWNTIRAYTPIICVSDKSFWRCARVVSAYVFSLPFFGVFGDRPILCGKRVDEIVDGIVSEALGSTIGGAENPDTSSLKELMKKVDSLKTQSGITLSAPNAPVIVPERVSEKVVFSDPKTAEKMKLLTQHVQHYLVYSYLSSNFSSFFGLFKQDPIDSSELLKLAAQAEIQKETADPVSLYIDYLRKKYNRNKWNPLTAILESGIRFRYWYSYRLIHKSVSLSIKGIVSELQSATGSTEARVQKLFGGILEHVKQFLESYNKSGSFALNSQIGHDSLKSLCDKISPLVIERFFPNIRLFENETKPYENHYLGFVFAEMDKALSSLARSFGQWILGFYLPDILHALSTSAVTATVATDRGEESSVNLDYAIPMNEFANKKLTEFVETLQTPNLEIEKPLSKPVEDELTAVVSQIMQLADVPNDDQAVVDGIRDALIRGTDSLRNYLKKDRELLLSELLSLANIPFEEKVPKTKADQLSEYKTLKEEQAHLVSKICDKLFEQSVQKQVLGISGDLVKHHVQETDKKMLELIAQKLKESKKLQEDLKSAEENRDFSGYLRLLSVYRNFWETFTAQLEEATAPHNPNVSRKILMSNFSGICALGSQEMDEIEALYNHWIAYQRWQEVELELSRLEFSQMTDFLKIVEKAKQLVLPQNNNVREVLETLSVHLKRLKEIKERIRALGEFKTFFSKLHPIDHKPSEIDALLRDCKIEEPILEKRAQEIRGLWVGGKELEGKRLSIVSEITQLLAVEERNLTQEQTALFSKIEMTSPSTFVGSKTILKDCRDWVQKIVDSSKAERLALLKKGRETLGEIDPKIAESAKNIAPSWLLFPFEYPAIVPHLTQAVEAFGVKSKDYLKDAFLGILNKVGGLLTNKTTQEEENLYFLIEKVALHEVIKYFQSNK